MPEFTKASLEKLRDAHVAAAQAIDDILEEDAPKPKRKPAAAEDDEDDAPKPKRRAKPADDEDEDDAPKAKRRAKPADDDDEDDAPKPKRRAKPADDDDEDDAPKAKRKPAAAADDDEEDGPRENIAKELAKLQKKNRAGVRKLFGQFNISRLADLPDAKLKKFQAAMAELDDEE
mgnify:CR=1 FL=1